MKLKLEITEPCKKDKNIARSTLRNFISGRILKEKSLGPTLKFGH